MIRLRSRLVPSTRRIAASMAEVITNSTAIPAAASSDIPKVTG